MLKSDFCARLAPYFVAAAILALPISVRAQLGPAVTPPELPQGKDVFSLTLDEVKQYSAVQNFEILGHEYFKIPERTPFAKGEGRAGPALGSGFNTVRVYDGIAYLGGYDGPPTLFGILIADVHDPLHMVPLSFIPCHVGTRCPYLRVNREKKILMFGNDVNKNNPIQPTPGQTVNSGWEFYDVSDPRHPKELSFVPAAPNGSTHGMAADDNYVYGCGQYASDVNAQAVQIIDYSSPDEPVQVSTWHVPGQVKGEQYGPLDMNGPDGKPQLVWCHEIVPYNNKLYIGYRDSGVVVLDVSDKKKPKEIANFDYIPPYYGSWLGGAHTVQPIIVTPGKDPDLVVVTDEIFTCPQGFGRILDISDLKNPEVIAGKRPANPQLLSTFRIPSIQDNFDFATHEFVCPKGPPGNEEIQNTTHLPWVDQRSPSLVYVTWYDEGVRVLDISNPYAPQFIGYYKSPRYNGRPKSYDRQTREIFQDPDTNLLYVTDGNGGGLTVLRYTGPIPAHPPLPGAR